ncbi:MAG: DNA methyltransferase, partial [Fimbriimonas sp.]
EQAGRDPTEAEEWEGWGTTLKPAHEPIVLARKPIVGTTVDNVLAFGTGLMNIDGCRIRAEDPDYPKNCSGDRGHDGTREAGTATSMTPGGGSASDKGRWPANVIFDEEAAAMLDEQSGLLKSGGNPKRRGSAKFKNAFNEFQGQEECVVHRGANAGGASRFFYCAKATAAERGEGNNHPTVKPIALMRHLVRLVTPIGGTVVDPYMGSGSTAIACAEEGMNCIAMEREQGWVDVARVRLSGRGLV